MLKGQFIPSLEHVCQRDNGQVMNKCVCRRVNCSVYMSNQNDRHSFFNGHSDSPGRQIFGRPYDFSTQHPDMCAGGLVPLSPPHLATANSTNVSLKVCVLMGNKGSNQKPGVCCRVQNAQTCVLAGVSDVLRSNYVCWRVPDILSTRGYVCWRAVHIHAGCPADR